MQPLSRLLIMLICLPGSVQAGAQVSWQTIVSEDPISQKTACLMVSSSEKMPDGQTTTPVQIYYNGAVFLVKTESNIDLSYPGLGLQVDAKESHPIGRIHKKTNVTFEKNSAQLHAEFIRGLNARLTLGFWPTWPKTQAYKTDFNLRGFSKAYQQLLHCQQTGETP